MDLGSKRNWSYLEWRGGWSPPGATPSTVLLSHDLDLRPDESTLSANLESSVRRALRKAEKAGLEIEFRTDAAAMEEYYRLHCLTRRKHGLPPQPIRFFRKIQEHLVGKGMGFVGLATLGGREGGREMREEVRSQRSEVRSQKSDRCDLTSDLRPLTSGASGGTRSNALAGSVFLHWNHRALYKFGASDEQFLELRANNLLMWKAFLHCKQLGCTSVGMGRTEKEHEGLRRFKLGWGTAEAEVPYFKFELGQHRWKVESRSPDGWHNHVFRALPGFMSRWAGQLLYPHLD